MSVLKFKKFHPEARIDPPALKGDVGYDIYATEEVMIFHGEDEEVPVGFALEIPEGYYVSIETRSGHGVKKSIRINRGIIDSGYRAELSVRVYNHHHQNNYLVKKGEKIAQLVLHKAEVLPLEETLYLSSSERGEKGFGSTGR